jgi:nitronate monooxygenase
MPSLHTPLCDLLGTEYPILCAGMGSGAGPDLAAAVSNAGGFGVLGASGVEPGRVARLVARTGELTDRPFGANLIVAELEDPDAPEEDLAFLREQVRAIVSSGANALVLFWGPADPFVEEAHDAGLRVLVQVGSVEEAKDAAEAGADAVIAQGFEAGGHVRGTTSVWALLPDTVEALAPLPVLASGGIGDGTGVARALALGAQGVSLGTRFVASDEFSGHPEYKRRVVESAPEDLFYGDLFTLWWPPPAPHRIIRNKIFEEWDAAGRPSAGERPGEGTSIGTRIMGDGRVGDWPRYAVGVPTPDFEGDLDYAPMWAGESIAVVNDIKPVAQIVQDLVRDAEAVLAAA